MKLHALSLGRFKAFGPDLQKIPIKPVTLIFGKNSAGKSSILHSLLWLNHAITQRKTDFREPVAARGVVNLGDFDDCVNQSSRTEDDPWFQMNFHVSGPDLRHEAADLLGDVSEFVIKIAVGRTESNREPRLLQYKVEADNDWLVRGLETKVNWDHPVFSAIAEWPVGLVNALKKLRTNGPFTLRASNL